MRTKIALALTGTATLFALAACGGGSSTTPRPTPLFRIRHRHGPHIDRPLYGQTRRCGAKATDAPLLACDG